MKKHLFIPQGEDRKATAELLVGNAEAFDIPTRDILVAPRGFWITERLADLLVDEGIIEAPDEAVADEAAADEAVADETVADEAPKKRSTKKTSGNRAEKKTTEQEGV